MLSFKIKAANPGAYQLLIDKDPKTWSRAFFKLDKGCKAVENGFSECFNSVLVSVRSKPLLTMLEAIRVIVLETMNTMRKISATYTDDICPSILMRIDLMKNHTRFWHVIHTGGDSFEDYARKANKRRGLGQVMKVEAEQGYLRSASGVGRNVSGFRGFDIPRFGSDVGGSRSSMGRNATCLGRSASGVGRNAIGLGRSTIGVGRNATSLSRSTSGVNGINVGGPVNVNIGYDNVFMGSTNVFVGSVSGVGGYAQSTGVTGIDRGVVRGSDIPRLKWSPPPKRAFNRVGGISFLTRPTGSQQNRPRQQKVRRGFARWFGDGDNGGVSYDMDADTQGNQTASQAIPSVQGSQTEVEIPTQVIPSQATNEVPPEVRRVLQH
ncbi:hypothetical protein Tco_1258853, partial [Tanacetum coccineum]